MQREMHQHRLDLERLLQLFNTHGTEIAPGSDVVGEDLQFDVSHRTPLYLSGFDGPWNIRR
jgi:hypothetical protein